MHMLNSKNVNIISHFNQCNFLLERLTGRALQLIQNAAGLQLHWHHSFAAGSGLYQLQVKRPLPTYQLMVILYTPSRPLLYAVMCCLVVGSLHGKDFFSPPWSPTNIKVTMSPPTFNCSDSLAHYLSFNPALKPFQSSLLFFDCLITCFFQLTLLILLYFCVILFHLYGVG